MMNEIVIPQQKVSIWQILFYFSMFILTVWLILKVTGVIQTPLWLEYGIPGAGRSVQSAGGAGTIRGRGCFWLPHFS
jgi:hypothetical protein